MKVSEWLTGEGARLSSAYKSIEDDVLAVSGPDMEITAPVIDERDNPAPRVLWRRAFMFLTKDALVTGQAEFRETSATQPKEGVRFTSAVIPLHSISEVSLITFVPAIPHATKQAKYEIMFNDGRLPMSLPPESERVKEQAVSQYLALGRYLMARLQRRPRLRCKKEPRR